jgi:hypothetical protein
LNEEYADIADAVIYSDSVNFRVSSLAHSFGLVFGSIADEVCPFANHALCAPPCVNRDSRSLDWYWEAEFADIPLLGDDGDDSGEVLENRFLTTETWIGRAKIEADEATANRAKREPDMDANKTGWLRKTEIGRRKQGTAEER